MTISNVYLPPPPCLFVIEQVEPFRWFPTELVEGQLLPLGFSMPIILRRIGVEAANEFFVDIWPTLLVVRFVSPSADVCESTSASTATMSAVSATSQTQSSAAPPSTSLGSLPPPALLSLAPPPAQLPLSPLSPPPPPPSRPFLVLLPRSSSPQSVLDVLCTTPGVLASLGVGDDAAVGEQLRAPGTQARCALRLWRRTGGSQLLVSPSLPVQAPLPLSRSSTLAAATAASSFESSGPRWSPFATLAPDLAGNEPQTVGEAAAAAGIVELLLELRQPDGGWVRGPWWQPGAAPPSAGGAPLSWFSLVEGARVDALNGRGEWREARLLIKHASPPSADVLFAGLPETEVAAGGGIERGLPLSSLAPPYSRVRPWRLAVRQWDLINVEDTLETSTTRGKWFVGVVAHIDHGCLPPTLRVVFRRGSSINGEVSALDTTLDDHAHIAPHASSATTKIQAPPVNFMPAEPEVPARIYDTLDMPTLNVTANTAAATSVTKTAPVAAAGAAAMARLAKQTAIANGTSSGDSGDFLARSSSRVAASATAGALAFTPESLADVVKRLTMGDSHSYHRGGGSNAVAATSSEGLCGLDNLGNTCFMNSLLQCVSQTYELTDYFLDDSFLRELNPGNPLGARGQMAFEYAALVRALWTGTAANVAPVAVKRIVGRHAPQFVGYGQQDAQEFASFFLDLLLEDLCRVRVKPALPPVEAAGRPEVDVAAESWAGYLARNDSKVADVFAGLFRSYVECVSCERKSVTFDPFTSVSVPIPTLLKPARHFIGYVGANYAPPLFLEFEVLPNADPTGAQLAAWVAARVAEHAAGPEAERAAYDAAIASNDAAYFFPARLHVNAAAASVPAAAPPGVPQPHEILIAIDAFNQGGRLTHAIVGTIPHWAPVVRTRLVVMQQSKLSRLDVMTQLIAYHVPGAASYAETAAAPDAYSSASGFELDVPHVILEEYCAASGDVGGRAGAGDGDDCGTSSDDLDDDDLDEHNGDRWDSAKNVKSQASPAAPAAKKPRSSAVVAPASPLGPTPRDYATVWLRRKQAPPPYSTTTNVVFQPLGSTTSPNLEIAFTPVVPLRFHGGSRVAAGVTADQFLDNVWQCVARAVGNPSAPRPEKLDEWLKYYKFSSFTTSEYSLFFCRLVH